MNVQQMLNMELPAVAEVSSLEALRVVSDSQRHRILSLLIREPLTPSQIANMLKIARTRVYYHLDLLEKHAFIRVVRERPVAAMIERTYRACAQRFKVNRHMLASSTSESEINDVQAVLLERAAEDLRSNAAPAPAGNGDVEVLVTRSFLRLTPEQAGNLRADLVSLIDRYANMSGDGGSYELAMALFASEGDNP